MLDAYRAAADRLCTEALAHTLEQIDFASPYHQAIGFYLERSGSYRSEELKLLTMQPLEFDFYLERQMSNPAYCPKWRVYYPPDLDQL